MKAPTAYFLSVWLPVPVIFPVPAWSVWRKWDYLRQPPQLCRCCFMATWTTVMKLYRNPLSSEAEISINPTETGAVIIFYFSCKIPPCKHTRRYFLNKKKHDIDCSLSYTNVFIIIKFSKCKNSFTPKGQDISKWLDRSFLNNNSTYQFCTNPHKDIKTYIEIKLSSSLVFINLWAI